MSPATSIAVYAATACHQQRAATLARQLALPPAVTAAELAGHDLILRVAEDGLSLHMPDSPMKPLRIDFTGGALAHRRQFGGGRRQAIARAVGLKGKTVPTVLDATAGLGTDGFVLASLGCTVHLVEKNPIIFALLEDAVRRLAEAGDHQLAGRMHLYHGDSIALLTGRHRPRPVDCVYLDPMFPRRRKTALVKKEMRILQMLATTTCDEEQLLTAALAAASRRVVVKRPRTAPVLAGRPADYSLAGQSCRFDVYLVHRTNGP